MTFYESLDMYTTREASQMLGISQATVIQYIRLGYLKASRFGSQYVISRSEIEKRIKHIDSK